MQNGVQKCNTDALIVEIQHQLQMQRINMQKNLQKYMSDYKDAAMATEMQQRWLQNCETGCRYEALAAEMQYQLQTRSKDIQLQPHTYTGIEVPSSKNPESTHYIWQWYSTGLLSWSEPMAAMM